MFRFVVEFEYVFGLIGFVMFRPAVLLPLLVSVVGWSNAVCEAGILVDSLDVGHSALLRHQKAAYTPPSACMCALIRVMAWV